MARASDTGFSFFRIFYTLLYAETTAKFKEDIKMEEFNVNGPKCESLSELHQKFCAAIEKICKVGPAYLAPELRVVIDTYEAMYKEYATPFAVLMDSFNCEKK